MRYLAPLLMVVLLGAALSPASAQPYPQGPRASVQSGQVRPLGAILDDVRRQRPGRLADVQGPSIGPGGEPRYRLKWVSPNGRVEWLDTDARTGRVLGVQGGPPGPQAGPNGIPNGPGPPGIGPRPQSFNGPGTFYSAPFGPRPGFGRGAGGFSRFGGRPGPAPGFGFGFGGRAGPGPGPGFGRFRGPGGGGGPNGGGPGFARGR